MPRETRSLTFPLRGGVAVLTGAANGIGAALALSLARRGCHLALADIDHPGLLAVAEAARRTGVIVSVHGLDVADAAGVAALPAAVLAAHSRISLLVNSAGIALGGRFEDTPAPDFDRLMAINFDGTVRMTRAFLPFLQREGAAQIVNLSSVFGLIAPAGQVPYVTSKFAVRGFSEALRHELEGSTVGLTLVYPGGVRTAIATKAKRFPPLTPAEQEAQAKAWDRRLGMEPQAAAEAIAKAILRRAGAVIIGRDARAAALVQRLFPARYWHILRRFA